MAEETNRFVIGAAVLALVAAACAAGCTRRAPASWRTWPTAMITAAQLRAAGMPSSVAAGSLAVKLRTRREGAAAVDYVLTVTASAAAMTATRAHFLPVALPWRTAPRTREEEAFMPPDQPQASGEAGALSGCDVALRFFGGRGQKVGAKQVYLLPSDHGSLVASSGSGYHVDPLAASAAVASWGLAADCRPVPPPVKVDWP